MFLFQPADPMVQRESILLSEALDVAHFPFLCFGRCHDLMEKNRLCIRKDISINKGTHATIAGMARNPMIQEDSARLQQTMYLVKVPVKLRAPHMLDHLGTDDFVEHLLVRQIAVVRYADRTLLGQAGRHNPLASHLSLTEAQCDADHRRAVVLRGIQCKPAPSTSDIEHPVSGLQAQLPAHVVQFIDLRLVQIIVAPRKVRAGVDHAAVQPQSVKLGGQVIRL